MDASHKTDAEAHRSTTRHQALNISAVIRRSRVAVLIEPIHDFWEVVFLTVCVGEDVDVVVVMQ